VLCSMGIVNPSNYSNNSPNLIDVPMKKIRAGLSADHREVGTLRPFFASSLEEAVKIDELHDRRDDHRKTPVA
jgi:hypothetical protein